MQASHLEQKEKATKKEKTVSSRAIINTKFKQTTQRLQQ